MTTTLIDGARATRRPLPDELIVTSALMRIPIGWVEPGPNVRGVDVGNVNDLAVSIWENGQETPIIVCQIAECRFEVIEGHRRRKAIIQAGLSHVDAVLRRRPNERDRIIRQLTMHTHAKPFHPIAEARAVHELFWQHKLGREEIARRLGRTPGWVRDRLALLNLSGEELAAVESRTLPVREALGVVRLRRAERDGRPVAGVTRWRPARRTHDEHFTTAHRLAEAARHRCRTADGHEGRALLGSVACGACWEDTIRADQPGRQSGPAPDPDVSDNQPTS